MFNIHRKLFLAFKQVQIAKITPPQVPLRFARKDSSKQF